MTPTLCRFPTLIARAAAALAAAVLVASCGGGVSANPSPIVDSPTLTILPASATLYSGMPTTFVLSGGTGAYIVTSDNQAVVPISGGVTGRSVTVVPNPVTADTTVTLTLRDTGSAAPVAATLTVRPGTVTNSITITPNPLQSSSCSPAVCSGGDAEVRVTLSQGGIPLAARGVRFEVMSGDFRFIVTPAGVAPEQTALSVAVATDETGIARARIRATALAPNQTALLRVTDMGSGAYRQTSFAIAQFTGSTPSFFTLPSAITFTGPYASVCAADAITLVSVFGGVPPYTIAGTLAGYTVNPTVVTASGGSFEVRLGSTPVCLSSVPIGVTDATGRTITVTLSSVTGTGTAPPPPLTVAPSALTLACSFTDSTTTPPTPVAVTSSAAISGGSGTFSASTDHPRVLVTVTDRTVTIQRLGGDPTTIPPLPASGKYPASGKVFVTDGNSTDTVTLTVPENCP